MSSQRGRVSDTRLPISKETREEDLRQHLRHGETWDDLLQRMAKQYDPTQRDPDTQG